MPPNSKDKRTPEQKAEERRQRNLASAYASRNRKRETIAHLEAEKARLNEANAMLRARLNMTPENTNTYGRIVPHKKVNTSYIESGPGLKKLTKTIIVKDEAAVDLLDRVLTGSHGKGPPVEPKLVENWVGGLKSSPKDPTKKDHSPVMGGGAGSSSGAGPSGKQNRKKPSSSKKR